MVDKSKILAIADSIKSLNLHEAINSLNSEQKMQVESELAKKDLSLNKVSDELNKLNSLSDALRNANKHY